MDSARSPAAPVDSAVEKTGDALAFLEVLDRLEVGPVRVEPDRLTAMYAVTRDGSTESTELVVRYEEAVFDPSDPGSVNLASLIVSQVALNYGLFCREMVFRGTFSAADRRFLAEMLENTAREIYVNKILADNPFLVPAAQGRPAVRRETYVRAAVRFEGDDVERVAWSPSSQRWAVLSSGGKDSLLSFGLLRELGAEVHPLYVNESGRHWFTALNAYRHFRDEVPNTARVWTNADRLFTWMLRQLPLVRSDFHRKRADIYPIRLWTVAVFLFSVLPILQRRGIGRLVIGDEHDTTVRRRHEGIPHYAGLYDQSRAFDHALSRFFATKGWGVVQLSLLRPLSEQLIQTILAQRYPDLLRCQTSCHATHPSSVEEERMLPCGRCEKCRRIVALLLSIGADPGVAGYSPSQVEALPAVLVEKGLRHEPVEAAHLAAVLAEKGIIASPRLGSTRAQRHPEVVSLRFHPRRSPINEVPLEIRRDLYKLFLEHAVGAVQRLGRQWVPVDLESEPAMSAPAPFDRPSGGRTEPVVGRREHVWGELTWPQAEQILKGVDVALLPVGAIEQHGHHLPLDTDSFDADYLVHRVAEACSLPRPLVLPLVPYGVSYHHEDFPGTLSVSNETLARFVYEIGLGVARNGIRKLIIVNGHGGNSATLHFAAQMINRDARIFTCVDSGETSDHEIDELVETPNDVHAGEVETSTTMAVRPEAVREDALHGFVPDFSSSYLDFTSKNSVGWYARTARISENGVFGDPTKASREKGEKMWDLMVHHLVELIEHLKDLSLEEIYERRY